MKTKKTPSKLPECAQSNTSPDSSLEQEGRLYNTLRDALANLGEHSVGYRGGTLALMDIFIKAGLVCDGDVIELSVAVARESHDWELVENPDNPDRVVKLKWNYKHPETKKAVRIHALYHTGDVLPDIQIFANMPPERRQKLKEWATLRKNATAAEAKAKKLRDQAEKLEKAAKKALDGFTQSKPNICPDSGKGCTTVTPKTPQ